MKCTALVTGASRGIGAAIAKALACEGHPVILNYRDNHVAAHRTLSELEQAGGSGTLWRCDVRDGVQVQQGLERFLENTEQVIGIVVNNAGVLKDAPFPALKPEDWQRVTRTTLDGFYNITRPLIMPMARRRWGRIVSIASVSGVIGNRGQTNYSAAKAGLIGATRSLALEFAKRNVTVNAVAPGLIDTEMSRTTQVEEITAHIPMQRLGKPEEVAALVRFLVSDQAAYITGQVIGINGGLA